MYSPFDFNHDQLDVAIATDHEVISMTDNNDVLVNDVRIVDQGNKNIDDRESESVATIQYVSNNCNTSSSSSSSSFPDIPDSGVVSSIHNNIYNNTISPLATYTPKTLKVNKLQQPKESRMKYLRRYPKLYQEFLNSGNLDKLKILNDDVLVKDCMLITHGNSPLVGRDKFLNVIISMQ